MATRLKKLRLTELSLVDSPANADAVVTLAKRYDEEEIEKDASDEGAEDEMEMDEEMEEGFDDSEADETDLSLVEEGDSDSTTTEDDSMSKAATEYQDKQGESAEDVMKNLPESVRKMIEDATAAATAATEQVAKMQEEKAQTEAIAKATSIVGKASGKVDLVASLLRKANADEAAEIERVFKAHNAALDAAQTFAAVGDLGSDSDDASRITKHADELRKSNPKLTREQAIAKAMEENPDAYEATLSY
jgi:hypothetical protein